MSPEGRSRECRGKEVAGVAQLARWTYNASSRFAHKDMAGFAKRCRNMLPKAKAWFHVTEKSGYIWIKHDEGPFEKLYIFSGLFLGGSSVQAFRPSKPSEKSCSRATQIVTWTRFSLSFFLKQMFDVKKGFRIKIQTLDKPAMFIVPCWSLLIGGLFFLGN